MKQVLSLLVKGFWTIRLAGSTSYTGREEIYHNGHWGTICDNGWGVNDAMVCPHNNKMKIQSLFSRWKFPTYRDYTLMRIIVNYIIPECSWDYPLDKKKMNKNFNKGFLFFNQTFVGQEFHFILGFLKTWPMPVSRDQKLLWDREWTLTLNQPSWIISTKLVLYVLPCFMWSLLT